MALRACYAKSGTELGYAATRRCTGRRTGGTPTCVRRFGAWGRSWMRKRTIWAGRRCMRGPRGALKM
eukprot:3581658-Rhodomonas_salina.1